MNRMVQLYRAVYPHFDRNRFDFLAQAFRLDPKKNLNTFSKGMRRQAAIILALSSKPDYVFFDSTEDDGMTELDECFYTHLIQLLEEVIETPHTADRVLVVLQMSTGVKTEGKRIPGEGWIAEFSITPARWEELKKMVPKEATSLTPR